MTIAKLCHGVIAELENGYCTIYMPMNPHVLQIEDALAFSDALSSLLIGAEGKKDEKVETVQAEERPVALESEVVEVKRRRGRPKKIDEIASEAFSGALKREFIADVEVVLDGGAVSAQLVHDDGTDAVAVFKDDSGASVLVVESERIKKIEPEAEQVFVFNRETCLSLRARFPIGAIVLHENEEGEIKAVVKSYFDDCYKVQIDAPHCTRVVDLSELRESAPEKPAREVVEAIQSGRFELDYGKRIFGCHIVLLDTAIEAAAELGMPAKDASLVLAAMVGENGFIGAQMAATAIALWFADRKKQGEKAEEVIEIDPPISLEEIDLVRSEVKAKGVTPAQAKDLCRRHFNKESAALLTRSEMQRFLGEVLPTFAEMQGAEDF